MKEEKKDNKSYLKKTNFINKLYIQKLLKCGLNECAISPLNKIGNLVDPKKGYLVNYLQLLNLINNIQSYVYIKFPVLRGRNEKDILDKLIILNQCSQERIVFYVVNYSFRTNISKSKYEDIYDKSKIVDLVFLKHSNIDNFVKVYFYNECEKGAIKDFKINPKNIEEILAYFYFTYSLFTYDTPKDNDISVRLFYGVYIYLIREELIEKYNIDIKDTNIISNYEKLYMLLDKLGYVKKFYKSIYPKIKRNASKVEKKITSHPKYVELLKYFHSYKPFEDKVLFDIQDIDINRLIDVHVDKHWNKKWIKDQFKIIQENKNFGIRI